jgi:hypothetical protein
MIPSVLALLLQIPIPFGFELRVTIEEVLVPMLAQRLEVAFLAEHIDCDRFKEWDARRPAPDIHLSDTSSKSLLFSD